MSRDFERLGPTWPVIKVGTLTRSMDPEHGALSHITWTRTRPALVTSSAREAKTVGARDAVGVPAAGSIATYCGVDSPVLGPATALVAKLPDKAS